MNRLLLLLLSVFTLNLFGAIRLPDLLKTESPTQHLNVKSAKAPSKRTFNTRASGSLMDTVPPILSCPDSDTIVLAPGGSCDTTILYSVTATDDQGQAIVIQLSGLASGSIFPVGASTCVYLATDLSGNTATCSFTFTVEDGAVSNLTCDDQTILELDANCVQTLFAQQVLLGGPYGCPERYLAEVDKTTPFGNGPWLDATFNATDIDRTYQYRVTDAETGNKCWGNVVIKDETAPVFNCQDLVVSCAETNLSPSFLKDSLGLAAAMPQVSDACLPINLPTYVDLMDTPYSCDSPYTELITRRWQAVDQSGNTSTCLQKIKLRRHSIAEMLLPPNTTLYCPDTNTDPARTGLPFLMDNGRRYNLKNNSICDISAFYNDIPIRLTCGDTRVRRVWEYFDFCTGLTEGPFFQDIYILDESKPSVACPASLLVTLSADTCFGLVDLPDAVLDDACSEIFSFQAFWTVDGLSKTLLGTLADFPGNDPLDFDTLGVMGIAHLPVGTTQISYVVEDSCGNIGDCSFDLTVADMVPPVAHCDSLATYQLLEDGTLAIGAATFDNGSTDDCVDLNYKVRFTAPSLCLFDTIWTDSLRFCCLNQNDTLDAKLRVYDIPVPAGDVSASLGAGHFTECAVKIRITDTNPPICVAPQNLTVSCEDFDPTLQDYGIITSTSCAVDSLALEVDYTQFDTSCSRGIITRIFKVYDSAGNIGGCAQAITVDYLQDYFVKFPDDMIVTQCDGSGIFGEPSFLSLGCEDLKTEYTDQVYTVVPDACFKIERTWKITNTCMYDPMAPLIVVPNPTPNPTTNAPANLIGPTVSVCGTPGTWSPSTVKINPTDPSPTNYCTFYNKDANGYSYKQIIKIIDGQAPSGTYTTPTCANQSWTTANNALFWNEMYWWDATLESHDLCEEPLDLSITATDACAGSNINVEYLLFLDLDGDGVMETVINSTKVGVSGIGWDNVPFNNLNTPNYSGGTSRAFDERPVPGNQKMGFAIEETVTGNTKTAKVRWNTQQNQNFYFQPELPHGTHRIKWFITDGCGNNKEYEYTFTVKDCKPPVVTCVNNLSVNILIAGSTTLWASDFLQSIEDNCTPTNLLKIGVRKCGTGTGFPVDNNQNPIPSVAFTCTELGPQCIELWSIDKAGNADYCEATVSIQDNLGVCESFSLPISGNVKTELGAGIEGVSFTIDGVVNFAPPFSYYYPNETELNGDYQIISQVPTSSNFSIKPELNANPLNGVTTYDLVLISKHILAITPLDSPFKMISADANNSGSITTFDMVEFRKLILGIYTELPNNTSWRFVDSSFVFPNPANPFQTGIPDTIAIQNVLFQVNGLNFIGMKVGDVNNTAVPNIHVPSEDRFNGTIYFDAAYREVQEAEVFELKFESSVVLEGCQFTLETDGLEILEIIPGEGMSKENFALFPQKSLLTMSWETGGKASFSLKLKAKKSDAIQEMLKISNQITPAEAYLSTTQSVEKQHIALRFTPPGAAFELFQNQPNPFAEKTSISFQLPEASDATLKILDGTGKELWLQKGSWPAGLQTIEVDLSEISAAGILYYKLETPTKSAVRKMARF